MKHHSLLLDILTEPTSPFREVKQAQLLRRVLTENKVPFFFDPAGNCLVGVKSKADYLKLIRTKSKEPVRLIIAHMDHPGFHGDTFESDEISVGSKMSFIWHGGSPTLHLENARTWLADSEGYFGEGVMREVVMAPHGRAIQSGKIEVTALSRKPEKNVKNIFGGFGFRAPVWEENGNFYTKAADDLVGVFAIVSSCIDAWKSKGKKPPVIGLISRAEEVGFIGTLAHFDLGWLQKRKREVVCLSLETSRTLPGAEIGKGPVVRIGDRKTVFHSQYTQLLTDLALKVLPEKHQRRIMDGGSCEGTAATAFGIPTIAISVPLGNYHNQSLEGGPDAAPMNGPAPEFISGSDIEGMRALIAALLKPGLPWSDPMAKMRLGFKKELKKYKTLMRHAV